MDKYQVQNFTYNGFYVTSRMGIASYKVEKLINWTKDSGIGLFLCSDKKERLIPTCQLSREFLNELPPQPKLEPLKGDGVLFGTPSNS
jgi:hypothetical protein